MGDLTPDRARDFACSTVLIAERRDEVVRYRGDEGKVLAERGGANGQEKVEFRREHDL